MDDNFDWGWGDKPDFKYNASVFTGNIANLPAGCIEYVGWDLGGSVRYFFRQGWMEQRSQMPRQELFPEEWGELVDHHKITYRDPDKIKIVLKFERAVAEYFFPDHGEPWFEVREKFTRSSLGIVWRGE